MPDLWLLIPLLLATGAFAGILSGLLGVGGGIVIVPFLFHLFASYGLPAGLAMPLAVGTSLATIVLTSLISARSHHAKGGVDSALVKAWIFPVLVGVVVGSMTPSLIDGAAVKTSFGVMLVLVSFHSGQQSLGFDTFSAAAVASSAVPAGRDRWWSVRNAWDWRRYFHGAFVDLVFGSDSPGSVHRVRLRIDYQRTCDACLHCDWFERIGSAADDNGVCQLGGLSRSSANDHAAGTCWGATRVQVERSPAQAGFRRVSVSCRVKDGIGLDLSPRDRSSASL